MKIILQAIKALFRKVENAIRDNVSAISKLSSKIASVEKSLNTKVKKVQSTANDAIDLANTTQSTANNAQTTANNAQTTANNAQTTANNAVSYNKNQTLTTTQKKRARANIDAGEPQIQVDWNETDTDAVGFIKNRICYDDTYVIQKNSTAAASHTVNNWYKFSNDTPSIEKVLGQKVSAYQKGDNDSDFTFAEIIVTNDNIKEYDSYYDIGIPNNVFFYNFCSLVRVVQEDTTIGTYTYIRGIYFKREHLSSQDSNTYPKTYTYEMNYRDFKCIDEKYIPNNFIRNGDEGIELLSSTADSTKRFKIIVDDSGTITATEVTS